MFIEKSFDGVRFMFLSNRMIVKYFIKKIKTF